MTALKIAWTKLPLVAAALVLTLASCGSNNQTADPNGRKFSQTYRIYLDPERALTVSLHGSFTAREDKSRADAGRTDLFIKSQAEAVVANVSDGRTTSGFTHSVSLYVPMNHCPTWVKRNQPRLGAYCSYDLFKIEVGELKAGDSQTVEIENDQRFPPVAVEDAATELNGIRGPSAVLLSTGDAFDLGDVFSLPPTEFNPTCGQGRSITYFSESAAVNACSNDSPRG